MIAAFVVDTTVVAECVVPTVVVVSVQEYNSSYQQAMRTTQTSAKAPKNKPCQYKCVAVFKICPNLTMIHAHNTTVGGECN